VAAFGASAADVASWIVIEVLPRKGAILARGSIENRKVGITLDL
jgi:hypothetical protein